MNRVKGFLVKTWHYWVGTLILLSVIFYYAFYNQSIQLFHYDMMEQGIRFVQRAWDLYREPGFELWDWTHYFGGNIFVHQYMLYSPFWLILVFLPSKLMIPFAFLYVNMFKLIILYLLSVLYFGKIRQSKTASVIGGLIITFSGFALGYYNYANFTDVLLFLPLALYFIEMYLDHNRITGFILTISAMAFINVYLFFMFIPYIFLYTLFRYVVKGKYLSFRQLFVDGVKFLGIFILGIGIASILFIPSLELLLSTSRISSGQELFRIISKFDLFRYLTSMLQPIVDRNNFNPLVSKFIVQSYGHSGGAALYSLIISPLLLSQLFSIKISKNERNGLLILLSCLSLIALFPGLYVFLQGNRDTRWMYMFILINAYIVSLVIDHITEVNWKSLVVSMLILMFALAGSYLVSRHYGLQNVEIYYSIAKRNIIVLGFVLLMYIVVFIFVKNIRMIKFILIIIVSFEAFFSMYNIFFNPVDSVSMDASELESYYLADDSIIKAIKESDSSIYRIDAIENYNFNNPLGKNYMGFTFYTNIYDYEIDTFTLNNIASGGGWVVGANAGKWQYKEMFGSKYWFDLTGGAEVPYAYDYYKTVQYGNQMVDVYINSYPLALAYTMKNTLAYSNWIELNSLEKFRALMTMVVTEDSTNTIVDDVNSLEKLGGFGTTVTYNFNTPKAHVIVYAVLPRSEEVKMTFKYNGEVVREYYSYEPQYSGVYVEETFNEVFIEVTNLYGVPDEEFINSAYIESPFSTYDEWYKEMQSGFIQDFKIGLNSFQGSIQTDEAKWVVTSIAYDKYWSVLVDGQKVKTIKVNGGFIGFQVQAGSHQIEAKYQPISFYLGIILTLLSSILLFIFTRTVRFK